MFTVTVTSESDDEKTSISVILNNEESIIQLMERFDTVSGFLLNYNDTDPV